MACFMAVLIIFLKDVISHERLLNEHHASSWNLNCSYAHDYKFLYI
jgi:hypothetical protein